MGQKSCLITLKNFKINFSLIQIDSFLFFYYLKVLKNFIFLLRVKNLWVTNIVLNIESSIGFLFCWIYFRSKKQNFYKYRLKNFLNNDIKQQARYNNILLKIFNKFNINYKINKIVFFYKIINYKINKTFVSFIFKKTMKFVKVIFLRQYFLYVDFLKYCSFLYENIISLSNFLFLILRIFRNLPKRIHSRFLVFIKLIFKIIIIDFNLINKKSNNNFSIIKGLKLNISGRLQGRPRASNIFIYEGRIPSQTISFNVEYTKDFIYTKLGAFGFKIWLFR